MGESEDQGLAARQRALDEVVTAWPDVKGKPVFGHRGYVHAGKMFGFLHPTGVAVKTWAEDAEDVYALDGVSAFTYNGMEMRAWPILPLQSDSDLDRALDCLRRAYEAGG